MALKLNNKAKDDNADPKPPKEKKELTEEQVKMRNMLIVVGILAVVTAGIYVPPMFSSRPSPPVAEAPAPGTEGGPGPEGDTRGPADGAAPGEGTKPEDEKKEEGPKPTPTPLPGAKPKLTLVGGPVTNFRRDPFEPFYAGIDVPDPTPTPIPSVPIPVPQPRVNLPRPGSRPLREDPSQSGAIVALPPVHISRISEVSTIPAIQSPFKRITAKGTSVDPADATPSYNKRLSGVIIGDGVRALLEINTGEAIVTRVVQPGDEVDGITVLSIQRVSIGNQTVTRMLIREKGEEKFVDLKPSAVQPNQQPGGAPIP